MGKTKTFDDLLSIPEYFYPQFGEFTHWVGHRDYMNWNSFNSNIQLACIQREERMLQPGETLIEDDLGREEQTEFRCGKKRQKCIKTTV